MQPNVANFGDTVVELAALANTAVIVSAAVVGAWVTWHIRKSTPYSVGAFFGGAGAGFAIGRNIWQAKSPMSIVHHLTEELFGAL